MYVTICSRRVPVIAEMDLRDDAGSATYGLFRGGQGARGTILLDVSTPPTERRAVLVHEIGHAYDFFVGRVASDDEEGRQQRIATIDRQLQIDLADQGGDLAIHAVFGDAAIPAEVSDTDGAQYVPVYDDQVDWPTSVSCPICREEYAGRIVRDGMPAFDPKINGFVLRRVLTCGKCDRESAWYQRCSHDGVPWPSVVQPPVIRDLVRV